MHYVSDAVLDSDIWWGASSSVSFEQHILVKVSKKRLGAANEQWVRNGTLWQNLFYVGHGKP